MKGRNIEKDYTFLPLDFFTFQHFYFSIFFFIFDISGVNPFDDDDDDEQSYLCALFPPDMCMCVGLLDTHSHHSASPIVY